MEGTAVKIETDIEGLVAAGHDVILVNETGQNNKISNFIKLSLDDNFYDLSAIGSDY